jgi:hypothetical protein
MGNLLCSSAQLETILSLTVRAEHRPWRAIRDGNEREIGSTKLARNRSGDVLTLVKICLPFDAGGRS